jgi:antitoxin ParD1/3/4
MRTCLNQQKLAKFCQSKYFSVMSKTNISLPDTLKSFVDEQVNLGSYGTSSEYIRELIRRDQDRLQMRNFLIAGATSQPTKQVNAAYFDSLRDRIRKASKPGPTK